ncbi:PrpF domain-containing protein [Bordetella genomosp. 13]|uniref:PrpF domain-containing protein n=1 Tax=Bordetella genomosp. 13 TaxID=463040 RepID=UPI0011AA7792|nr:PrpF domain-containing protein [Bordetella genomosp. 13]
MRPAIPFTLLRGGTSKGVFMPADRLPTDRAELATLLLEIFGSPDARQIDGMGGGDKLTSKACIMGPPTVPDADIDYLFGQVGIRHAEVDFNLNCGNLTAGAAAYAVHEGYVAAQGEHATVRIHNVNTGRIIVATVPLCDGAVQEDGPLAIGGVPGTGAAIDLDFHRATGAITGALLPLGAAINRIDVPGYGPLDVSVVDGPNLIVLVHADDLGMSGIETPDEIDGNAELTALMQRIRETVAIQVGLEDYWRSRAAPSTPMLVAVQSPREYRAYTNGARIAAGDVDLVCRQYSTSATSKALAATVSAAVGMACRIPGTLAARHLREGQAGVLRLGHPSGTIHVDAAAAQGGAMPAITAATIQRTARLIARGELYPRTPQRSAHA